MNAKAKLASLSSVAERRNWILSLHPQQVEESIEQLVDEQDVGLLGFFANTLSMGRDTFCEDCGRSTVKCFPLEAKSSPESRGKREGAQ